MDDSLILKKSWQRVSEKGIDGMIHCVFQGPPLSVETTLLSLHSEPSLSFSFSRNDLFERSLLSALCSLLSALCSRLSALGSLPLSLPKTLSDFLIFLKLSNRPLNRLQQPAEAPPPRNRTETLKKIPRLIKQRTENFLSRMRGAPQRQAESEPSIGVSFQCSLLKRGLMSVSCWFRRLCFRAILKEISLGWLVA